MARHAAVRLRRRFRSRGAAAAGLLGVSAIGVGGFGLFTQLNRHHDAAQPVNLYAPPASSAPVAAVRAPSLPPSARPLTISIPTIGVHSALVTLGLTTAGALATPTDPRLAGWYTGSAVPGASGPAVIAGHVDSLTGPAVFTKLRLLRPGDTVDVSVSTGVRFRFRITAVQHYAKNAFPTAAVYGPLPDPELRLITCGGAFRGDQYVDDVVVFARLLGVES